jgi:alpha-1,2-mannosyltransferase
VRAGGRILLATAVVLGLSALAWFLSTDWIVHPSWDSFFDLRVYRGAVRAWLSGHSLYGFSYGGTRFGFTYPPFAALVMLPMAALTLPATIAIATAASAVAIGFTTWQVLAPIARRHGRSALVAVALAVPVVCAMEPVRETIAYGQVNLLLAALVLADVVALRRGWRWAGVGIGLATAIKLTPGLFVVYLVLSGRRRAGAVAVGTFVATGLLALAVDPGTSVRYWTATAWDTSRIGLVAATENQSLLGTLARFAYPGQPSMLLWALLCALVLALGLWRAVRAARAGDELTGVVLTGLAACLLSPISWTHHLYFLVPAVAVLVDVAAGTPLHGAAPAWLRGRSRTLRAAAGAGAVVVTGVLVSGLVWYFGNTPPEWTVPDLAARFGASGFALLMLVLLVLLPVRAPAPQEPGGTVRRANASATSTWRIVSSTTREPWPASNR